MSAFDDDFKAAAFPDLVTVHGDAVAVRLVKGGTINVDAIVELNDELDDADGMVERVFTADVMVAAADYPTRRLGDAVTINGREYKHNGVEEIDAAVVVVTFERRELAQAGDSRTTRRG